MIRIYDASQNLNDTEEYCSATILPDWTSDLIDLGEWVFDSFESSKRKIVVVWLPTRILASAFLSMGIMVASARRGLMPLNYTNFLNLPFGTKVLALEKDNRGRSRAVSKSILPGRGSSIRCLGGRGRTCIYEDSFPSHSLYPYTPLTERQQSLREDMKNFFSTISGREDGLWALVSKIEAVIVTNRKGWNRHVENISLIYYRRNLQQPLSKMTELLQAGGDVENNAIRILLSSPGDQQPEVDANVPVLLDGPDALLSITSFHKNDVVILLDECEYDSATDQTIRELLSRRDEWVNPCFHSQRFQLIGCTYRRNRD